MQITLSLDVVVLFLTALTLLGSIAVVFFKLASRFENACIRLTQHSEDIKITIRCVLVCLDGLTQLGANGAVKTTKEEVERYLIERRVKHEP